MAAVNRLMKLTLHNYRNNGISSRWKQILQQCKRHAQSSTYVLLPEVPPDTADTNTLMRLDAVPNWFDITPSSVFRACGKLAIQYEIGLASHCEQLKDLSISRSVDDIFLPLEEITVPLQYAYKSVRHLSLVKKKVFSDAFEGVFMHVNSTRNERWRSEILHNVIKELNANRAALNDSQKSMVDMYLREGRRAGVDLQGSEKATLIDYRKELSKSQDDFRRRVYYGRQPTAFEETVYDKNLVNEMPESIRRSLSVNKKNPEEGPWKFTIESATIYKPTLEYCPDRQMRQTVWEELMKVGASVGAGKDLSNKKAVESIRYARGKIASIQGYNSYAEMTMQHRMAGSIENVMEFLETLRATVQPQAKQDLAELQKYAGDNGFGDTLQMWDVDYWSRRQREELYDISPFEPNEYFSAPEVLYQFQKLAKQLFGVDMVDSTKCPTWHPSVLTFAIKNDDGEQNGLLFLDLFKRFSEKYGGSWIDSGRDRSTHCGVNPISYVSMNIHPSIGEQPPLMSFHQVAEFYSMMGHALQQILTTAEYSEISGQQNIEWDAVHVSANLMVMLLYSQLKDFSHWKTKQPIPTGYVQSLSDSRKHMLAYGLMKKIFFSVFDLEMHINQGHWHTAMTRIWSRYMIHPLVKTINEPLSRVDIFADDKQAAGQYGLLWSQMLAADIYDEIAQNTNNAGRRFRDTFLALGGSVPSGEVFRRFKGRDPSFNSYIDYILQDQAKSLNEKETAALPNA